MASSTAILCLLTGSVESAAAAILTKGLKFSVAGACIRNKYLSKTFQEDQAERAEYTCKKLDIPFRQIDLPEEDWNNFEINAIKEYEEGRTPDLNVLFTRDILFSSLVEHSLQEIGANGVSTGHFARTSIPFLDRQPWPGKAVSLMRPVELGLDDTHALCQMPQRRLMKTIFPLGDVPRDAILPILASKDLQSMSEFSRQTQLVNSFTAKAVLKLVPKLPGKFVNTETGRTEQTFENFHEYHVGQVVEIGDQSRVITNKDVKTGTIQLAPDSKHPLLYVEHFFVSLMHWIHQTPYDFYKSQMMYSHYRCSKSEDEPRPCAVTVSQNWSNAYCGSNGVIISVAKPVSIMDGIVPGNYCSLYKDNVCLGSGRILRPGPSVLSMKQHIV